MTSAQPSLTWHVLQRRRGSLADVRLECHHAVQLNTRFARGFLPERADDSHTSLTWDSGEQSLRGEAVSTPEGPLTLSLRIADLTMLANSGTGGTLPLSGKTIGEAKSWLAGLLRERGMEPAPLEKPLHFKLDEHPLLHGAKFSIDGRESSFRQLSDYYHDASLVLQVLADAHAGASPVRCWPHHFDIATLLPGGGPRLETIGVGLLPGDQTYADPYFYVSPLPYPSGVLPALASGFWHTAAWTGAVLSSQSIEAAAAPTEQQRIVEQFIGGALGALRSLSSS
jgi:hypothetical protein